MVAETGPWFPASVSPSRAEKIGYATRLVYHGRIVHKPTRTWQTCPHKHLSPGQARKCSEAHAARCNRKGWTPEDFR